MPKDLEPAVAYLRTSSAANVGAGKDSEKRQRAAIEAFAERGGFTIMGEYCDAAVSGADPIDQRPGFVEMLQCLASNGARTIIVESPDRGPGSPGAGRYRAVREGQRRGETRCCTEAEARTSWQM
jgi:DNA invertase Pin-like site-specific DNA recombinase